MVLDAGPSGGRRWRGTLCAGSLGSGGHGRAMSLAEDEGAFGDVFAKVLEGIGHGLEAPTIVVDGEVSLGEGLELSVGVESARLLVPPQELGSTASHTERAMEREWGAIMVSDSSGEMAP